MELRMSQARLEVLRADARRPHGKERPTWTEVRDLIFDLDAHRARVQVTDDDIRAAGLRDWRPNLIAWARDHSRVRYFVAVGIYVNDGDGERLVVQAEDEYHRERHRGVTGKRWPPATASAINALAEALGRAPLDVLAEIAATEVSDG